MSDLPTEIEHAVTTVVDSTPVDFDDAMVHAFVSDVAQRVHSGEVIAVRYGFARPEDMLDFIRANTEVRRRIKQRRAIWESDDNVAGRARELAGHTVVEALPALAKPMFDPGATAATRLDTAKLFARIAGVDGLPPGAKDPGGPAGNQFVINFTFSGNRRQLVSATAVDAVPDGGA